MTLQPSSSVIYFLENYIGTDDISEVDALTYIVLNKADKHVPYGELVGTVQQKYNVIDESSHKQKSL